MSTTPITLDFSKAQPINQAQGVTLDFSKAVPLSAKPLQQPVQPQPMSWGRQPGSSMQTDEPVPTEGLEGFEYNHPVASALGETAAVAGIGAGAAMSPEAIAALRAAAAAHPFAAKIIARGLESFGVGAIARKGWNLVGDLGK